MQISSKYQYSKCIGSSIKFHRTSASFMSNKSIESLKLYNIQLEGIPKSERRALINQHTNGNSRVRARTHTTRLLSQHNTVHTIKPSNFIARTATINIPNIVICLLNVNNDKQIQLLQSTFPSCQHQINAFYVGYWIMAYRKAKKNLKFTDKVVKIQIRLCNCLQKDPV